MIQMGFVIQEAREEIFASDIFRVAHFRSSCSGEAFEQIAIRNWQT